MLPDALNFVSAAPFIVNTGQATSDLRLRRAFSQTAAHSALTLDGLDDGNPIPARCISNWPC